ncbi:MAG: hypothetical protein QM718_14240 [Steroidobacteraceae bacterium]
MRTAPRAAVLLLPILAVPLLGGCSHLGKLAFWRRAPAGVEVAQEISAQDGTGQSQALAQTWQRNAVRVDVTALAGQGQLVLHPLAGHDWPIRLEFLARPGAFTRLQVSGDQRVILAVPAGGDSVVLKVPAGVYSARTKELVLSWSSDSTAG